MHFTMKLQRFPKFLYLNWLANFDTQSLQIETDKFKMTNTMSATAVINMSSLLIHVFFKHIKHT